MEKVIGINWHAASCVDENGKVECTCGLEERELEAQRYWDTDGPYHDLEEQTRP